MAFVIGTSTGGGKFLASELSTHEAQYDPVYDTDLPVTTIWNLLPDFYRLMDDRDVVESLWTGLAQVMSGELLNLWQVDYAKNLRDVPTMGQRKWVLFDFVKTEDFVDDPELTTAGLPSRFTHDAANEGLSCMWMSRGGVDRATVELNGAFTEDASVTWSFELSISSIQAGGVALVGYQNSSSRNALANALLAGVVGDDATADTPYPVILHISPTGSMTYARAGTAISVGTVYRFDCSYTARTGILAVNVVELDAQKVTGVAGETAEDDDEDTYTSEFRDDSADFDALGIVAGDTLTFAGSTYTLASVSGALLTTSVANMPAGASGLSYEIRGEDTVLSLSLDLPNEASDASFTVDLFGVCTLDTRIAPTDFAAASVLNRKRTIGAISTWSYMDPTTEVTILKCPRLQDAVVDATAYLYEGTDYSIEDSTFQFQEPPTRSYWAEYAAFDEEYIKSNFGSNVGLEETSSDSYKAKVRGLYYSYYRGPTVNAIRTGVHILVGLPIADAAGTVESINPTYSGDYGQIVVDGTGYLYPRSVGTSLQVGDSVEMFQPLSDGVEVQDYVNTPRWWTTISDPELSGTMKEYRKYHSFAIVLNMDAFDLSTLTEAAAFVDTVKPTWKDPYFIVYKELADELDVVDDLEFTAILNLWDVACEGVLVRYDSADYEGGAAADWRVDQGFDEPDDLDELWTSGAIRGTAAPMTGHVEVTLGNYDVVGVGTSFTTEVGATGLQGTTTDNGVAGSTDALGTTFTGDGSEAFLTTIENDTGVPAGIVHIYISGVGLARVTAVTSDTTLTIAPLGAAGPFQNLVGVTYAIARTNVYVAIGRYFAGSTGTTTLGAQTLQQVGAFGSVQVGDRVDLDGEEYEVQSVTSADEVVLDRDAVATHAGDASWAIYGTLTYWAAVVYVTSDTVMTVSQAPTSAVLVGTTDFHAARIDARYLRVYADQYDEACPEEDLELGYEISAGYMETPLTGRLTFSQGSTLVTGSGTNFVGELGGPGVIPPGTVYITTPDGTWWQVDQVVDADELIIGFPPDRDYDGVRSYRAHEVLSGTFSVTNGSATVTCSADQRGTLSAGDWIQIVPVQDTHLPTSNPVVQVLLVEPTAGLSLTLTGNYGGATTLTQFAIRRGTSAVLPLTVATATGNQNFTGWCGTPGGHLTSIISERAP